MEEALKSFRQIPGSEDRKAAQLLGNHGESPRKKSRQQTNIRLTYLTYFLQLCRARSSHHQNTQEIGPRHRLCALKAQTPGRGVTFHKQWQKFVILSEAKDLQILRFAQDDTCIPPRLRFMDLVPFLHSTKNIK